VPRYEQDTTTPRYLDPELPAAERAADLLSRLGRAERLAMLHQVTPAVDRLGLPAFRTGTEALHGVAWLGTATVFPQPVGLAATWDDDLLRRAGDAVATEVRAKHAADPSVSLNVWAPVVNPLRHPAWGRGEEGWSEDPHLTARLATAYARGLRGGHPRVWKTVPTLKHFLAYGVEADRAVLSASLPLHVLHEWELPAYRGPVEAGVVGAVMPSYNLVNGRPNHVARELLDELRSWTDASLAVVSDAGAPTNLVVGERYFSDHAASHAAAVRAGVDSFTDHDADAAPTVARLTAALDRGLLDDADVDRAVLRLLELRIRTGELDGEADPYRAIGADAIDVPAHRALAREAVARSVVLLRNDGLLPLRSPGRLAVVGPLADRVLTDWYSGTPPYETSVADAVATRYPGADVTVVDGADLVALRSTTTGRYLRVAADAAAVVADARSAAAPDTHLDVTDWGDGVLTLRSVGSGRLLTGATWIVTADAPRVGGWVAQEAFRRHHHRDGTWSLQHVGSGRWLRVQQGSGMLVAEAATPDEAERFALRTVRSGEAEVARAAADADAVLVVVGNDPHVAGRETEDRPHLRLPRAAEELWRVAHEANPRTALVVVSSYPYVLGDAARDAAAVVWTSHGGQELGPGLVDVLSGDVEPAGRLAQSWPATEDQPGDLHDHDVARAGATYRYATGEPAFAFGHGLGYTTVVHERLALDRSEVPAPPAWGAREHGPDASLTARVSLRNAGDRPAEELAQVYALPPADPAGRAPRRLLVGHARVRLAPGERRDVEVAVDLGRLATWDVAAAAATGLGPDDDLHVGAFRVRPGTYVLATGPSSADLPLRASLRVTGHEPAPRAAAALRLAAHASHADAGTVLGDRTREAGTCVDVAPGAGEGWVRHDLLDLAGVRAVRVELAGPGGPSGVRTAVVEARRAGSAEPWTTLARADDTATSGTADTDPRYAWRAVTAPVDPVVPGGAPVDVRVRVVAGTRLAWTTFVGDGAAGTGRG